MKGGIDDSAKDLSPDTEYIVYAYGTGLPLRHHIRSSEQ